MFDWSQLRRPRSIVFAAIAGAVVLVVAALVINLSKTYDNVPRIHPSGSVPMQTIGTEKPEPTDIQTVMNKLGPFDALPNAFVSNAPDTNYPAIVLINADGSESASANWTLPATLKEWEHQALPQIVAVQPTQGGYIVFKIGDANSPNTYIVKAGQAFIVESVPQYVVRFNAAGSQWTMGTVIAYDAKRHL